MADKNTDATAKAEGRGTFGRDIQTIVSRILSLSIFFVGIGVFAAIGFGMTQMALFAEYQVTYFAVGAAVGVVGILLWLVAR